MAGGNGLGDGLAERAAAQAAAAKLPREYRGTSREGQERCVDVVPNRSISRAPGAAGDRPARERVAT